MAAKSLIPKDRDQRGPSSPTIPFAEFRSRLDVQFAHDKAFRYGPSRLRSPLFRDGIYYSRSRPAWLFPGQVTRSLAEHQMALSGRLVVRRGSWIHADDPHGHERFQRQVKADDE